MDAAIGQVRSFNRVVTRRIGALEDEYLARGRPLGASRALWEIGAGETDLRALRARLDLDSGYLSRLVAALEREGLVERRRPTRPTAACARSGSRAAGRAERAELDRASDALAGVAARAARASAQRERLVEAMATVERLLTAGLVEVAPEDPASADAQRCLERLLRRDRRALRDRLGPGGRASGSSRRTWPRRAGCCCSPGSTASRSAAACCGTTAAASPTPSGCGSRPRRAGSASAAACWPSSSATPARPGVRTLRLETNRALTEAIALYRAAGYEEVERVQRRAARAPLVREVPARRLSDPKAPLCRA